MACQRKRFNYIVSSSILSPSVLEVLNGRRAGDEYVLSMEGRNNKRPQHAINHRYLCKWNIDVYVNKQRLYGQNKVYRQWVALQVKVKPVYWIAVDLFTSASIYLYRDMCSIFIHVNNRLVLQAVFAKTLSIQYENQPKHHSENITKLLTGWKQKEKYVSQHKYRWG